MHSIGQEKKMRCNFNFFFLFTSLVLLFFQGRSELFPHNIPVLPSLWYGTHLSQNFFGGSSSRAREEAIFIVLPSSADTQHTLI